MVALGVPTVLAGILALVLPETAGKDLPQTIHEADQVFVNFNQHFCKTNYPET